MRILSDAACAGTVAAIRVLLLPGAYHQPEDFITAGFVTAVRQRRLPVDLFFIEPQMRHLTDRSLLQQLCTQLLLPAREQGCGCVWVAGVSLGGMLALQLAQRYAQYFDGLCLLAPYLGNRGLIREIERTGLAGWQAGTPTDEDEERGLWHFLRQRGEQGPRLFLGYGRDDRFNAGHRLLAQILPALQVNLVDGGHDWRTWRTLWDNFLDAQFGNLT